jgi:hypothetical protein
MGVNGINSIMQQQMHISEQLSSHHAGSNMAAAAMNAHGRKTPRSVALTMPPLQDAPSAGPSAPPGMAPSGGNSHQRLRAGGRPQLSQPQNSGGPWDATGGAGMNALGGTGNAAALYAPGPLHHQQQGPYASSGGASLLMPASGTLGALPNILNSNYNNINLGQHPQQQGLGPAQQVALHQADGASVMRGNVRLQAQYGYEGGAGDFGAASVGAGGGGPLLNPNSGYSGMQHQVANASGGGNAANASPMRRQVSRESPGNAALAPGLNTLSNSNTNSNHVNSYTTSITNNVVNNYAHLTHNAGAGAAGGNALAQQQPHAQRSNAQQQQQQQHRNHNTVRFDFDFQIPGGISYFRCISFHSHRSRQRRRTTASTGDGGGTYKRRWCGYFLVCFACSVASLDSPLVKTTTHRLNPDP